MDDALPPGFERNTPEQMNRARATIQAVARAALQALAPLGQGTPTLALVLVMPDNTVTAGLVGDVLNLQALSRLMVVGPETLRITVERFVAGRGETTVVPL